MVSKSYADFMDELSADELYEGLLAYGFFAENLPPIFTSVHFYDYCKKSKKLFNKHWNEYITFRVMRNISIPRLMGIPNPFKYEILCSELRDDWDKLRVHFYNQTVGQNYRISRIHIRKEYGEKRIFAMNYKNWSVDGNPELDLLINDKGTSRYFVQADISSCFPSIYTHSIPWALVGKNVAKQNRKNKQWYNRIDKKCSDMRNGETHGLLIGPHASNLLSEIILTVVDKKLYDKGYRYIRNIDDYDCFVNSYDEAQRFLRDLQEELRVFDLPLNHKKTKITELPIGIDKNWKHQLSDLPKIGELGIVEYPQVNTFIDTALKLAKDTSDFAIINFSIKKLKGTKLSIAGKKLAAKRFMHLGVIYPYLLHLMEEFVFNPYNVKTCDIKTFSDAIYRDAIKQNDYESMCYSIYFALQFGFDLDEFQQNSKKAITYVINSYDCILLTITWLYLMRKNNGNRRSSELKLFNNVAKELKNSEMDRYWLFCYEVLTYNNLSDEWKKLKRAKVSFIKEKIRNNIKNNEDAGTYEFLKAEHHKEEFLCNKKN